HTGWNGHGTVAFTRFTGCEDRRFFYAKKEGMLSMKALLALEDGRIFWGRSVGAAGERAGEVVFNTSMTGYGEILTDPSYRGQLVTLTTAHVGNYGVTEEDLEAERPWVEAL